MLATIVISKIKPSSCDSFTLLQKGGWNDIFQKMSFKPCYGELPFQHPCWNDIFEISVNIRRIIDPIIFVSIKNEVNVISTNKFGIF